MLRQRRVVFRFAGDQHEESRPGWPVGKTTDGGRHPDCGTLCCRQWQMELCDGLRHALLPPVADGALRRTAARSAAASGGWKLCDGLRHALLPPVADGSSAPCGAELFIFSCAEEAPHRIRQSRIYHGRQQSVPHSAGTAMGASKASRTQCRTCRRMKRRGWAGSFVR